MKYVFLIAALLAAAWTPEEQYRAQVESCVKNVPHWTRAQCERTFLP
jgi:hypothetical protein|nr:MAG TPA: hypothetical protein [Caudoviricetes sp.]